MKFAYFDDYRLGVVRGDSIVDVTASLSHLPHRDRRDLIVSLIADFDEHRAVVEKAAADGAAIKLADVKLRAPIPRPGNIDCMALNYMEDGHRKNPPALNAFHKAATAIIGDGDTMTLPDTPASTFEAEAEIALVIGKRCENIAAETAMEYVFGFTNLLDGSARGLRPDAYHTIGTNFHAMKSRTGFGPIGPFLVTADEIADVNNLQVRSWNNGIVRQDYNTSDMAHKIPRVLQWLSSIHALEPGDIVALGTNHHGLHALQDGDLLEMEVEGLGRLHIPIADPLQRVWPRETRRDRAARGEEGPSKQLSGKYAPTTG